MDFTISTSPLTATKTPDTDTEPPSSSDPKSNSLSFTNGALKTDHHPTILPPQPALMVVAYKECLKNHAASIGGHALDGCGEFMPGPSSNPFDPTSLKCAACGCHRNFHRRDQQTPKTVLNHHHYHRPRPRRLLPPPPTTPNHHISSPSQSPTQSPSLSPVPTMSPQSPPPVSHLPPSYFASPPQMLLALSTGFSGPSDENHHGVNPRGVKIEEYTGGKKRSRTKFSQEQKEKMCLFAEKVGWRMQKSDGKLVEDFCNEVGVGRRVLKVWMHNNKHSLKKRLQKSGGGGQQQQMINGNIANEISNVESGGCGGGGGACNVNANPQNEGGSRASFHVSNNGSSSSS